MTKRRREAFAQIPRVLFRTPPECREIVVMIWTFFQETEILNGLEPGTLERLELGGRDLNYVVGKTREDYSSRALDKALEAFQVWASSQLAHSQVGAGWEIGWTRVGPRWSLAWPKYAEFNGTGVPKRGEGEESDTERIPPTTSPPTNGSGEVSSPELQSAGPTCETPGCVHPPGHLVPCEALQGGPICLAPAVLAEREAAAARALAGPTCDDTAPEPPDACDDPPPASEGDALVAAGRDSGGIPPPWFIESMRELGTGLPFEPEPLAPQPERECLPGCERGDAHDVCERLVATSGATLGWVPIAPSEAAPAKPPAPGEGCTEPCNPGCTLDAGHLERCTKPKPKRRKATAVPEWAQAAAKRLYGERPQCHPDCERSKTLLPGVECATYIASAGRWSPLAGTPGTGLSRLRKLQGSPSTFARDFARWGDPPEPEQLSRVIDWLCGQGEFEGGGNPVAECQFAIWSVGKPSGRGFRGKWDNLLSAVERESSPQHGQSVLEQADVEVAAVRNRECIDCGQSRADGIGFREDDSRCEACEHTRVSSCTL